MSPQEICVGMPKEFVDLLIYTRNLKFEEEPDYDMILNTLKSCLYSLKLIENDFIWIIEEKKDIILTSKNKRLVGKPISKASSFKS